MGGLLVVRSGKNYRLLSEAEWEYAARAGKRAVTAETDLLLCRYFGLSDGWWLAVQSHHDTRMARRALGKRRNKVRRCPRLVEAAPH
jgi:formylglycine-generating enzyme required for sulfatase activity